ncbi:MAG: inverse autotransporter beta domain-containing protein [Marinobacterium sp.]|nr:inverse autotransporter beta domain-containing protein [Marinobacterium sp.]
MAGQKRKAHGAVTGWGISPLASAVALGVTALLSNTVVAQSLPGAVLHNSLENTSEHDLLRSELMMPLRYSGDRLFYSLLSGVVADERNRQLGLGLGIRQRWQQGLIGGYINWDYLQGQGRGGSNNSHLQQLTLGAEWLTQRWQLHGNLYLPLKRDTTLNTAFNDYSQQQLDTSTGSLQLYSRRWREQVQQRRELLAGADLELGYRLPLASPDWQWQLKAGISHREGKQIGDYQGGWLGSAVRWSGMNWLPQGSVVGLEVEAHYDERNKENHLAALTLSIPFGMGRSISESGTTADHRLNWLAPIERQRMLSTTDYQYRAAPMQLSESREDLQLLDGRPLAGRSATQVTAGQSLQQAINSGAEVVMVAGTHQLNEALALEHDNQLLVGADTPLRTVQSGQLVTLGEKAVLRGNLDGQPLVEVSGDGVQLHSLTLENQSTGLVSTGVNLVDAENAQLINLTINTRSDTGFGVVQQDGNSQLTDVSITTAGRSAHGVLVMQGGEMKVNGRYHFSGVSDLADEGSVSLQGRIMADYLDEEGDRQQAVMEQNITGHNFVQVGGIEAGAVLADGKVLENGAIAIGGGAIGAETLFAFAQLRRQLPQADTLVMGEVEGSVNDQMNQELGRALYNLGMNTHLVAGGQTASGGVDLFLAGRQRTAGDGDGARFGVHSWGDFDSSQPTGRDLPRSAPEHQPNLHYLRDIGQPDAFYWYTLEAAAFNDIHWMTAAEISQYQMLTR